MGILDFVKEAGEKLAEKEIKNCQNLVSGSFSNLILMTR